MKTITITEEFLSNKSLKLRKTPENTILALSNVN